jgi:hypothetical protein
MKETTTRMWKNRIKLDYKERMGWYRLYDLAQDRGQWQSLANRVRNLRVS